MITSTLQLLAQTRALHWTTKSYNQHVELGNLYSSLDELTDELVETLSGYEEVDFGSSVVNIETYDKVDLEKFFINYIMFITSIKEQYPQQSNICDTMVDAINKTRYLILKLN